MKKSFIFAAFLLSGLFFNLIAQEYYIEGFYERHGEGQYTLKDVHTNGIYLDGQTSLSKTIYGTKSSITCDGLNATMVRFSFKMATTDCRSKWDNGFEFQYWDEDNNKWKTDVEACRNADAKFSQNDVMMMLVLDYSSSMKNNISSLQSSAIKFINALSDASEGNIHVGIIAFSGMDLAKSQVFPITPLKKNNRYEFERFIRNSSKGQETALYYSMDRAIQMLEEYVSQNRFSSDKFNGSFMITFTDGLDNASINDDISVSMHRGRKNEYLAYISNQLQGANRKYILGLPLESFAIGFTGSEDFTREDIEFFRDVLQQTTPDQGHFKLASHFEEVEAYFEYIIQNLTKRWEDLNMYIGESQYGRVRWVLKCATTKPPKVKKSGKFWLGIGVEVGNSYYENSYYTTDPWGYSYTQYEYYSTFNAGLRMDAAVPLCSWFSLGGTISVGTIGGEEIAYRIGALTKFTFSRGSALILGAGMGTYCDGYFMPYVTLGWKFRSPWYINVSANEGASFSFGVGYSIIGGR